MISCRQNPGTDLCQIITDQGTKPCYQASYASRPMSITKTYAEKGLGNAGQGACSGEPTDNATSYECRPHTRASRSRYKRALSHRPEARLDELATS